VAVRTCARSLTTLHIAPVTGTLVRQANLQPTEPGRVERHTHQQKPGIPAQDVFLSVDTPDRSVAMLVGTCCVVEYCT